MLEEQSRTLTPGRRLVPSARWLRRCSLALSLSASSLLSCRPDSPTPPALGGALGPTRPADAGTTPIVIQAERGQVGADVQVQSAEEDATLRYVTAAVNVTDPPATIDDPRVSSIPVVFSEPGDYEIYVRFRIGPGGSNDDSFFVDTGTDGAPSWQLANGLQGYDVEGEPGYQPDAIVTNLPNLASNGNPGVWKWALLDARLTVPAEALEQTVHFATREDGLELDAFGFAIVGDGYTTGFTTAQLDAGEAGVIVYPPVLPDPYEPPADQMPLAVGASKFLGMVCCGNQGSFLPNYFNQVVPENGGKWGTVEGTRDEYNWAGADEALAVAQANGFPFRFHVLLWGSQQPAWIATLPPDEQLAEIRQWMEAVSERYGSALDLIEVVNEFDNQPPTAENDGNYIDALGGTGESGFDWVLTAFRMAREIFPPTARLMLNEYSVINSDARTDRYLALIQRLQEEDLVDAIGEQAHAFSTRGELAQMVANIDRLGATGLPLYLTEMDIDGPEVQQLIDFQRLFPTFWESPYIAGITLWGYREGMWRDDFQATLVYPNGAEKPAFRWLKGYLRGTAPVVLGPATATAAGSAGGIAIASFDVQGPGGTAVAEGAVVNWAVADGAAAQAVAFAEGTGRLELVSPLPAGTYPLRVYVDVDATVSNLFTVELTIQ
jgi:endo-1,4-beta-xylanase